MSHYQQSFGGIEELKQEKEVPTTIHLAVPYPFTVAQGNLQPNGIGPSACTVQFVPPLYLNPSKKYRCVPYGASIPYTVPNIGPATAQIPFFLDGNNRITMAINPAGAVPTNLEWVDYALPQGLYGYTDIAFQLNLIALANGWINDAIANPLFALTPDYATSQILITITTANFNAATTAAWNSKGLFITFLNPSPTLSAANTLNSIGPVLGWPVVGATATVSIVGALPIGATTFVGPNQADFAFITQYTLNCSFVTGAYANGQMSTALLNVPLGQSPPNSIMAVIPNFEQPVSINQSGNLASAQFWWVDTFGNPLPTFGAPWSLTFAIEEN